MAQQPRTNEPAPKEVAGTKSSTQSGATAAVTKAAIVITMVAIDELRPSGWNPNKMTEEQYSTYAQEVKSTGRIPKPIVVIKTKTGFRIIDGEHAWRAAKDAGMTHVPCEIVEVDIFEAMRQTIVRNRHGDNDPILLGRLYARMLKENKMSKRELAVELGLSEGSIRNHLSFGEAARLRNDYAPKGSHDLIRKLSTKQVATYLALKDKGNEWLDEGADLNAAKALLPPKEEPKQEVATKQPVADQQCNEASSAQDDDADTEDNAPASSEGDKGEQADAGTSGTIAQHDDTFEQSAPNNADDTLAVAPKIATSAGDEVVPSTSSVSTVHPLEPFQEKVLNDLNSLWGNATTASRRKFLAGAMADPATLAMVRQMIEE